MPFPSSATETKRANPLLEAALSYAKLGWRVFPCRPREKRPLIFVWQLKATTDPEQICRWWTKWPDANVAIATGAESGIIVVDLDRKNGVDGVEAMKRLAGAHGALPQTAVAKTGTGGLHLYFKHPGGRVPNSASKIGIGIDLRGDDGFVLAPPSVNSGGSYEWEVLQ